MHCSSYGAKAVWKPLMSPTSGTSIVDVDSTYAWVGVQLYSGLAAAPGLTGLKNERADRNSVAHAMKNCKICTEPEK